MRKRYVVSCVGIAAAVGLALYLLSPTVVNGDHQLGKTILRLRNLGDIVSGAWADTPAIETLGSLKEFLALAASQRRITNLDELEFVKDGWDGAFKWLVQKQDGETSIRITSNGSDRIYEGGEGDDLFVEIRKSQSGDITVVLEKAQ